MSERNRELTFDTFRGRRLDPETLARVGAIIPDDALKTKRLANLSMARHVVVARDESRTVGVAFVRMICGVPNVTWVVAEGWRRRGIAGQLVATIQQEFSWLTAICRNEPSVRLARRAGFWVFFGRLALWLS